jgi:drug/metabolite transporter (DMT)-like permease
MNDSKKLSLGTFLLLAAAVALDAGGTLLLSGGMKHVGSIDAATSPAVVRAFGRAIARTEIWLGMSALIMWFLCSLILFSRIDFSYVQPTSAIGYVLVALLGYLVLGETVTAARWIGVLCVCAGVTLIGRTPPRTTA